MARLPRLTLAGSPHHVIQRGNNRQLIFASDADRKFFLDLLDTSGRELGVAIHSYVLMDNHIHLLATPDSDRGLPDFMQAVGRRYVRYFNDRQGRTGTLWEGRYRSTLVQAERYLLACMAYIDLNPVRAGMAAAPAAYPWSSHRYYAGLGPDRLVTPHPLFWELGNTPFAREAAYTSLVEAGIAADLQGRLTDSTLRGWALGDATYLEHLGRRTERRAVPRRPGRPRKMPANSNLSPIQQSQDSDVKKWESDPQ